MWTGRRSGERPGGGGGSPLRWESHCPFHPQPGPRGAGGSPCRAFDLRLLWCGIHARENPDTPPDPISHYGPSFPGCLCEREITASILQKRKLSHRHTHGPTAWDAELCPQEAGPGSRLCCRRL